MLLVDWSPVLSLLSQQGKNVKVMMCHNFMKNIQLIHFSCSIGYGVSLGGISAMLTMLNSCAPGVGVVNIDNGFGAAALAYKCIS